MARRVIPWEVPVIAKHSRSCELRLLSLGEGGGLRITLQEYLDEPDNRYGRTWKFEFWPVQAFRWTTDELSTSAVPEILSIPAGGFYIVENSDWLASLEGFAETVIGKSKHYIVMCYDDVIEVLAWDCTITEVPEA